MVKPIIESMERRLGKLKVYTSEYALDFPDEYRKTFNELIRMYLDLIKQDFDFLLKEVDLLLK